MDFCMSLVERVTEDQKLVGLAALEVEGESIRGVNGNVGDDCWMRWMEVQGSSCKSEQHTKPKNASFYAFVYKWRQNSNAAGEEVWHDR